MLTPEQLTAIMPGLAHRIGDLAAYLPHLNAALDEFEITTPRRAAAFLAQLAHESGELRWMEELASGAAYDHRRDLGNTTREAIDAAARAHTTPGRYFKGHGPIQVTGYTNHKAAGEALGIDAVNSPRLLAEAPHAFRSAGHFWKSHGLNELADQGQFLAITHVVNGGERGRDERQAYYDRAKRVLGVT